MKSMLTLAALLCLSLSAFAGTKDSTGITPRNLSEDPSLSGKSECRAVNQRWNVDASTSGRTDNLTVGSKFDDIDASSESSNCSVSLTGYDGEKGTLRVKSKSSSSSCVASVTFCALGGLPSCRNGSLCNPGSTPPPPGPSLCPSGYSCACGGDVKVRSPDQAMDQAGGGYRILRRGSLGPWNRCP